MKGGGSSTDVCDSSHNISLLPPCFFVHHVPLDGFLGRLLKGILLPGAGIPDMSHNPKSTFAELPPKEGWTCAQRACAPARSVSGRLWRSSRPRRFSAFAVPRRKL